MAEHEAAAIRVAQLGHNPQQVVSVVSVGQGFFGFVIVSSNSFKSASIRGSPHIRIHKSRIMYIMENYYNYI